MPEKTTNREDRYIGLPGNFVFLSPERSCLKCKHKTEGRNTCKAFPGGIPEEILAIKNDHIEPFDGDNGIQFEGREGWPLPARLNKE